MMSRWLLVPTLSSLLAFSGCGSDSKIRSMDDYDLAQRYGECLDKKPTAPGKAQACENLRRECERRKEELKSFVCRTF